MVYVLHMKNLILSIVVTLLSLNVYATNLDTDLLSGEFNLGQENQTKRSIWLIGEVTDTNFRVLHTNDEDLLGFLHKLDAIPSDDDIGRTAGLNLTYQIIGENGRLDISANSQLFTRIPDGYTDSDDIQDILEETSLSVVARIIHSEEKKTYFIVGMNYTHLSEKPVVMTYLQDFVHQMGAGTPRVSLEGDLNQHFVRAIVGAGKVFEVIRNQAVAFSIAAEVTAELATRITDQSRLTFVVTAVLDVGLWRDSNDPVVRLTGEVGTHLYTDRTDFWAKVELMIRLKLSKRSKWYIETGVFVGYYDTQYDNQYEGDASFQTGISIRITRATPRTDDDHFLFN